MSDILEDSCNTGDSKNPVVVGVDGQNFIYRGITHSGEKIYRSTECATIMALEDAGGGVFYNVLDNHSFEVHGIDPSEINLIENAKLYATKMHNASGKLQKYSDNPYILHPAAVARLISMVTFNRHMIAAAWLHDVVEDTVATHEDIENLFGFQVASLVEMVTDISRPEDGNRAVRKAKDLEHLKLSNCNAQTIKYADIIVNSRSILENDKKFAVTYIPEMVEILKHLDKGDRALYRCAKNIVSLAYSNLFGKHIQWL